MNKLDKSRNSILLFILIAIVILSIIIYIMISILMKKLRKIISILRKIQEGNLEAEIPDYGNDEIGELAYHFRKMLQKVNELITDVVIRRTAEKDAEIRALQSQINAHFIYNVLEAVNMMAEIEYQFQISDVVTSLGRLMRYSMSWSRKIVAINEEINHIKDFIKLVNIRYDNEIQLNINIEDNLLQQEILKMSLQPIVENAIFHGFVNSGKIGEITIKCMVTDKLVIIVSDNGVGFDPSNARDEKSSNFSGIGLNNIDSRIKMFCGESFGIEISSIISKGTTVKIYQPLIKEDDNCDTCNDS